MDSNTTVLVSNFGLGARYLASPNYEICMGTDAVNEHKPLRRLWQVLSPLRSAARWTEVAAMAPKGNCDASDSMCYS